MAQRRLKIALIYAGCLQEMWKCGKMVTCSKQKTGLYPFLPARAVCTSCGEAVDACSVGRTVPSITYTKGIYYPWGLLCPLPGTGSLRIVSLCAASAPSSLLLMALGLLNGCWPSFWTLVVSRALVTRMELRTVYMYSGTLLFIFWPWCLLMMIYFYLSERSVKIKWFRARALEEKLY